MPSSNSLLKIIAERTQLEEGEEGIRRILRETYRNQRISTKELATLTQLPVPITAAIRKELEKEGLLTRNGGASLTQKGEKYVKEQLGLTYPQKLICPTCNGRTIPVVATFTPLLEKLRMHLSTRPKALSSLDQAHGTSETVLLRALYMLEKGDVEGRRILFLGDDDLTSIAVGLLQAAHEVAVIDVDSRLLETIQHVGEQESLDIACIQHDLRKPLPEHLRYKYDVVFTDPPYTIPGLTLFLSQGITALRPRKGASIYLAFAHQPSERLLNMQRTLNAMGLAIAEQIPRFNTYEGAEMFANTTLLARLETTEKTKPLITEAFEGKLYTGEITQTIRTYQCQCSEQLRVGATEAYRTIEELKEKGCPKCGKNKGFKLIAKQKLKEDLAQKLAFRGFKWSDFPVILVFEREISKRSFPEAPILDETYHRQKLEKALDREPEGLRVAFLDSEVVGWLWLRAEKDRNTSEEFGYIKSIIVKPEYRHLGFGRKLMELTKSHFLNRGIKRVDLIVSAANFGAIGFFDEMGFEMEHSTMRIRL